MCVFFGGGEGMDIDYDHLNEIAHRALEFSCLKLKTEPLKLET